MSARIDAHQHFWRYRPKTHAWINDAMASLKRDFLPEDLKPLLRASGFDGSIAVQAQQDVAETEWLLSLADDHDVVRGVVGWVDLRSRDVERDLARLSQHPKLVGVRHVVQDEPAGFMAGGDFRRGIAALEQYGLAYDILIYERQIPEAVDLVRAFPHQRFVLDHIGKPNIRAHLVGTATIDAWRDGIRLLAEHGNVYCKLSGLVTEADWRAWQPADFTPYIETVVDAFTPARCMIGSDWPVCTLGGTYERVLGIVSSFLQTLPLHEREFFLGGVAEFVYRR